MTSNRRLLIAIPFYRGHDLVRPLAESLARCSKEIIDLNARVIFYNDSPDCIDLRDELKIAESILGDVPTQIYTNHENIGFVKTCNKAIRTALIEAEDILLLNSDTVIFPGTLTEMSCVAYEDPMIAFVNPRSNNATLATFPHHADRLNLSPERSFEIFNQTMHRLGRFTYVPTAVGFCLYIKHSIIAEFGGFDPIFGKGYNEENDLVMRANRFGYRAVLANHAFVWHLGEASFKTLASGRAIREKANAKILNERFPEYNTLIASYFNSPEYRAEALIIADRSPGKSTYIGFDFSDFGTFHNGTLEAGKRLLEAANRSWPKDIQIFVYMDKAAWYFHGLDRLEGIIRRPSNSPEVVDIIVRMGQPFSREAVTGLMRRASIVGVFMLDTIAEDCGYLHISLDDKIWPFVTRWSDIIFTNSAFTADQYKKRHMLGENTEICISPHSFTPDQYLVRSKTQDHAMLSSVLEDGYILVFGNKLAHKALHPTLEKISAAMPGMRFVALGCEFFKASNVYCVANSLLSDEDMDYLFSHASCIVFPTHYEGFGFPLMHALARQKPIFVRPLPPFEEAVARISQGSENIFWYKNTDELARMLALGVPKWRGPAATGETDGWYRSASEVLSVLRRRLGNVQQGAIVDRLRWVHLLSNGNNISKSTSRISIRVVLFDLVKFPGYYASKIIRLPTLIYSFGLVGVIQRTNFAVSGLPSDYKNQFKFTRLFKRVLSPSFRIKFRK